MKLFSLMILLIIISGYILFPVIEHRMTELSLELHTLNSKNIFLNITLYLMHVPSPIICWELMSLLLIFMVFGATQTETFHSPSPLFHKAILLSSIFIECLVFQYSIWVHSAFFVSCFWSSPTLRDPRTRLVHLAKFVTHDGRFLESLSYSPPSPSSVVSRYISLRQIADGLISSLSITSVVYFTARKMPLEIGS